MYQEGREQSNQQQKDKDQEGKKKSLVKDTEGKRELVPTRKALLPGTFWFFFFQASCVIGDFESPGIFQGYASNFNILKIQSKELTWINSEYLVYYQVWGEK